MGEIISANAEVARIDEHIHTAFKKATARGGEIAELAANRLGPSIAAIDGAAALLKAAGQAEDAAWEIVLAEDVQADSEIGRVRDEMWNALGRPKQSAHMDEVFPGGISTYTAGDPRGQPLLMQVLHARILAASAPQWTEPRRQAWAAAIETRRVPYAAAADAHRATEAALTVANVGYRAAVRAGHARLRSFKRDLKSAGLTETQIHELIPDAGTGRSRAGGGAQGGGATGGGTQGGGETGGGTQGGGENQGPSQGGAPA